jgi:hypothetical protein
MLAKLKSLLNARWCIVGNLNIQNTIVPSNIVLGKSVTLSAQLPP